MEKLNKKFSKLIDLIKALAPKQPSISKIPPLPNIKPPTPPSLNPPKTVGIKLPGVGPDSKKDPKKVAQQIKDGSMSTKTQKIILKSKECLNIEKNGQWNLEKTDESDEKKLYHIHQGPHRITDKPLTLQEIKEKHGSVQKLENSGFRLIPHKPESP